MRKIALSLAVLGASLLAVLYTAPAHAVGAQSRVWVAFNGVAGSGTCSTPATACTTFAYAISQAASGGEVNCVTSGEFGPVTINWPITIDCKGVYAGIEPGSGVSGITVDITTNGGAGAVTIRGLNIDGVSAGTSGTSGITISAATTVNIEDVTITNFAGTNSGIYDGRSTGGTYLVIKNTTIRNIGYAGIWANGSGTPIPVVTLENVLSTGNGYGVLAGNTEGQSNDNVGISRSVLSGNTYGVYAGATADVLVDYTVITGNGIGVSGAGNAGSAGPGGPIGPFTVIIANSDIYFNTKGIDTTSGATGVVSYGTNKIYGNGSAGYIPDIGGAITYDHGQQ